MLSTVFRLVKLWHQTQERTMGTFTRTPMIELELKNYKENDLGLRES